jgi:glycosyltransferase involved in cell wall biosynthesis
MNKHKVVHIIAEVDKSHHFEWLTLPLKDHFHYTCILIGKKNSYHERFLVAQGVKVYALPYVSKRSTFQLIRSLINILRAENPVVVHTHFWIATLIGIPVAGFLRIPVKLITRHHGDLHHRYYPKGVMLDRMLNRLADHVISPTAGIKNLMVASEGVASEKITVIHHGVDLSYYQNVTEDRKNALRARYKIPQTYPMIGMISRYVEWKGIQYALDAFKELLQTYPDAHLVLANANGDYKRVLEQKLGKLQPSQYTEVNYESDTPALYALFDVFVHVPIDKLSESFGLIYIEALAAGVPSVVTKSGIACDFIEDERNALVVEYRDSTAIAGAVNRVLENAALRGSLISNGRASVQYFTYQRMGNELIALYQKCIQEKSRK